MLIPPSPEPARKQNKAQKELQRRAPKSDSGRDCTVIKLVPPQWLATRVIQDQSISGMRMDQVNNSGSPQWIRGRTRLEGRKTAVLKLGVEDQSRD